jgi:hypothetical protein
MIRKFILFYIAIALVIISNAFAALEKNAYEKYSMKHNVTNKTTVILKYADNVTKACEEESVRRGNGGFKGKPMEACSFHDSSSCMIIVPTMTNNDMLGHELHHCLSGSFH